jgi:uncharacterized membrane protein YtjA (UPF0391 family)
MDPMRWTIAFLIAALIVAVIGITTFGRSHYWIEHTLFVIFLLLAIIMIILYWKPSRRL